MTKILPASKYVMFTVEFTNNVSYLFSVSYTCLLQIRFDKITESQMLLHRQNRHRQVGADVSTGFAAKQKFFEDQ